MYILRIQTDKKIVNENERVKEQTPALHTRATKNPDKC